MTISLVIPAFNEQDNIASCLDHALAQSPPFDEIIVVDNTSTDDTLVIAQRYAADHPGIRVIEERRRGVAFARRTGFDSAHGDIIGRVDADVRMSPGWTQSVSDSLSDGRWAAVTGVTMFYDAPAQDAFTAAFCGPCGFKAKATVVRPQRSSGAVWESGVTRGHGFATLWSRTTCLAPTRIR